MKFVCVDCEAPMKLQRTDGPDEGSLTVLFRCPACGARVAMLTNPFETQLVRSLGVKIGGREAPAPPLESLRTFMANPRADAFGAAPEGSTPETASGCPFGAMLNEGVTAESSGLVWTAEAESRMANVPSFIRPMARRAIERFAEGKGYATITDAVMDEARGAFGM